MSVIALYARVSTDAQKEEGYSIDAQNNSMVSLCAAKNFSNHELYTDAGFTGADMNRPELKRLISNIKNKKVSRVIVYKLDRLSRNLRDTMYLIEDVFVANNVDFVSLTENLDTSTPLGRAMIAILSAFAQLERENIRERTRMGMKERVKDGYWMGGGRIPYGYDYDRNQGILIPNQDAIKVRQMFSLYLQGRSTYQIAKIFGLKCERLAVQILKRKSNIGIIEYNGIEYKGRHEPIIDAETYYRTLDYIQERSKKRVSTGNYLLTGLLECGKCGAKMRYQKWGKHGVKIVCYSSHKSKPYLVKDANCDNIKHWAQDIENKLIYNLFKFSYKQNNVVIEENPNIIETLEKQYKDKTSALKRLYNLYASSQDDILLDTINEAKKALSDIEKQIGIEREVELLSKKNATLKNKFKTISESWSYMTKAEQKAILQSCIEKITVNRDNLEIKYKFDSFKLAM